MKKIILFAIGLFFLSCSFSLPVFVPDDYPTLQAALDAMPNGGTIVLRSGIYYGNVQYGTSRTASILINGNRNIEIIGDGNPVITFDPQNPPSFYGEIGPVLIISNTGQTTIDGVHFIGTRSLGDPLYDLDVCIYSIADAPFTVRNSEIEQCGHAGIKHGNMPSRPLVLIENNRMHDNGFISRDHDTYLPGGAEYVLRNNACWNTTGWCIGYGNSYYTTGAIVENNTCVNEGGCVSIGWGMGAQVSGNFGMFNTRGLGLYYDGGDIFTNNTFLNSYVEDVYSERACGALVTNWCADPVPNDFFSNGNIYDTISHPDRIE